MRPFALGVASSLGLLGFASSFAADVWEGSLDITSDYLVRGISRSDNQGAVQGEWHYAGASGFIAGLFASSAKIDPHEHRGVELSPFLGYAWTSGSDWHGKIVASHYAYPWNDHGRQYHYDELDLDFAYQSWLDLDLVYSPNSMQYLPHRGLVNATAESADVNLQWPLQRRLSAIGGLGYSYQNGPEAGGYVYWSLGAAYDFGPVSLALSYVDSSAAAKTLFYNAAAGSRWLGTVTWRF
jgi:uncharacterized protein (TIGR02001 family)